MKEDGSQKKFQISRADVCLITAILALILVLVIVFKNGSNQGVSLAEEEQEEVELQETEEHVRVQHASIALSSGLPEKAQTMEKREISNIASNADFRKTLPSYLSQQNERLRAEALANRNNPDRSALVLTPEEVDELEKSGNVIQ